MSSEAQHEPAAQEWGAQSTDDPMVRRLLCNGNRVGLLKFIPQPPGQAQPDHWEIMGAEVAELEAVGLRDLAELKGVVLATGLLGSLGVPTDEHGVALPRREILARQAMPPAKQETDLPTAASLDTPPERRKQTEPEQPEGDRDPRLFSFQHITGEPMRMRLLNNGLPIGVLEFMVPEGQPHSAGKWELETHFVDAMRGCGFPTRHDLETQLATLKVLERLAEPPEPRRQAIEQAGGEVDLRHRLAGTVPNLEDVSGSLLEDVLNFNIRHRRAAAPEDYLLEFLPFTRQLAFATEDESWGELEKQLQTILRNVVRYNRVLELLESVTGYDRETLVEMGERFHETSRVQRELRNTLREQVKK